MSICGICGKSLSEAQYVTVDDIEYKSCPRCSQANGEQHVFYRCPEDFGVTEKRITENNPIGIQSHCQNCRGGKDGPFAGNKTCASLTLGNKWLRIATNALTELRYPSELPVIYKKVEELYDISNFNVNWDANIRDILQKYSSNSVKFLGKIDLFYSDSSSGKVKWGIRSNDSWIPEEVDPLDSTCVEGAKKQIIVNAYERNHIARKLCIKHYGAKCQICGFDFAKVYGKDFEGKIQVHHIRSIASIGNEYEVDPIKDLIPICPNCHLIAHCKQPPYKPEEIRKLLEKANAKQN